MTRQLHDSSARQGGFALLLALAAALALAVMAGGVGREARIASLAARGAVDHAQAQAAAEAAVTRAAALLAAGAAAPADWRFGRVDTRVAVEPERAKTDLNRAAPQFIAAAAQAAGLPAPDAFADAVVARRAAFAGAGPSWRLEALPFQTVGDAAALAPGVDATALDRIFTVHGGPAPDPAATPAPGDAVLLRAQARHPQGARAVAQGLALLEEGGRWRWLDWRGR